MANLLTAALPSSDEEDDDYDPTLDLVAAKKREKEELEKARGGPPALVNRARKGGLAELPELAAQRQGAAQAKQEGGVGTAPATAAGAEAAGAQQEPESWRELSRRRKRDARVDEAWASLKKGGRPREGGEAASASAASGSGASRHGDDEKSRVAFAADAIRTMKEAAKFGFSHSGRKNKVLVKETRNFAGKTIEVVQEVDAQSKAGAKAIAKSKTEEKKRGLDYVLQLLDKKRKLNIIDKSKLDWKKYKRDNKQVDEELQTYAKGGKTYTERQDFLKRTEMREYEIERDQRLNSSARTRGRL